MQIKEFEILNFRGIERAVLQMVPSGASVFMLIGLNESGKTTILEALSTFSLIKDETAALYNSGETPKPATYVPKHLKSNFTGEVSVSATIEFDEAEINSAIAEVEVEQNCKISSVSSVVKVVRGYRFENSDFKENIYRWAIDINGRVKPARNNTRFGADSPVWQALVLRLSKRMPRIIYFPTFLFAQPDKILLNPSVLPDKKEDPVNKIYREIIENVAKSLPRPLDVSKHIVARIVSEESTVDKVMNVMFMAPDKQQQVTAALSEISAHLTDTVFEQWSRIFGGDFSGREIVLRPGVDLAPEGQRLVSLQFAVKDGATHYDISERSLGFRWFFSFLLFTLYRVVDPEARPTIFLLDEPASNLHSRAQMQLLQSFPRIARGGNQIMYSTHSHYMIEPDWLDQAFIIANDAIDYDRIDDSDRSVRGRPTNIRCQRYRNFVGSNPDKATYFQPVLDKLQVAPSRLDLVKPSVLLEGKGDYLIVQYVRAVCLDAPGDFAVVPTKGADGMAELIGILLGWGVPFAICLDSDKAGLTAQKRYIEEWGLSSDQVLTLQQIDSDLRDKKVEDLLSDDDLKLVASHFQIQGEPTKSQIQLFFSEMLSRRQVVAISETLRSRVAAFRDKLASAIR